MMVATGILLAYLAIGAWLLIAATKNLHGCANNGTAQFFTHACGKLERPVGFWLSIFLSFFAILIALPMIVGSILGMVGLMGTLG